MPATSSPQVTAGRESEWTLETLRVYTDDRVAALRELLAERDKRYEERDRRYSEVAQARAEALRIKEEANRDALELARQIQTYKDNAHNDLINQLNRERGEYARKSELVSALEKIEAVIKPLADYITAQQGARKGFDQGRAILASIGGVIVVVVAVATIIISTRR